MDDCLSLRAAGVSRRALEIPGKKRTPTPKLSYVQQSSLEVLLRWEEARRSDPNIDHDAREAEADSRTSNPQAKHRHPYHALLASLKYSEFDKGFKFNSIRNFVSKSKSEGPTPSNLVTLRRQAVYYTACERMASTFFNSKPTATTGNALLTQSKPLHGASLVPEIFLGYESPYYLWDAKLGKVRELKEIVNEEGGSFPNYIAISHTWVRWQDKDAPWFELPGVPWPIPRNTKFDVAKLPGMLSALPGRYFWIDLLTIPQGYKLDGPMEKRKDWEIKCVPQTFRCASKALFWLDDISSWSALPSALEYLSLQYLSSSSRSDIDQARLSSLLRTAASAADKPLELLDHDKNRTAPVTDRWEPIGLFTSPWSFQETIIRPDILICDGEWKLLQISNDVPVALNDIAALLKVCSETVKTNQPQPLAVQELYQLFERTGFMQLIELTGKTSVAQVNEIEGCSPSNAKTYPHIVSSGGYANPHQKPSKFTPRILHN